MRGLSSKLIRVKKLIDNLFVIADIKKQQFFDSEKSLKTISGQVLYFNSLLNIRLIEFKYENIYPKLIGKKIAISISYKFFTFFVLSNIYFQF